MRFEIILQPRKEFFSIPLNYNYPIMVNLYKMFFNGESEFADWLHSEGYRSDEVTSKRSKLFTFSRLYTNKFQISDSILRTTGRIRFYFSTPHLEKQIQTFINGALQTCSFNIYEGDIYTAFTIENIVSLAPPQFKFTQKYRLISPAVSSVKDDAGRVVYLQPQDEQAEFQLEQNLRWKYNLLHGHEYAGELKIEFDKGYLKGRNRVSKLIAIKAGKANETKVRGYYCPLMITAQPSMQQVAYDCGLGEKNSMGLGCIA